MLLLLIKMMLLLMIFSLQGVQRRGGLGVSWPEPSSASLPPGDALSLSLIISRRPSNLPSHFTFFFHISQPEPTPLHSLYFFILHLLPNFVVFVRFVCQKKLLQTPSRCGCAKEEQWRLRKEGWRSTGGGWRKLSPDLVKTLSETLGKKPQFGTF